MPPTPRLAAEAKAPKAAKQLGTLGGGNHFLELLYDEGGCVWIMLHSGSRGIGAPRSPPARQETEGTVQYCWDAWWLLCSGNHCWSWSCCGLWSALRGSPCARGAASLQCTLPV